MGSSEDPDKSSIESSSPSQPLLSKHYPSPSIEEPKPEPSEPDQTQYLQISYNYGPRQFKDVPFVVLFVLFVLATFAFGIFASVNRNPDSSDVSAYSYDFNSTSCVAVSLHRTGASRSYPRPYILSASSSKHVLRDLIWTLVVTLVLSAPFGFAILVLLKHYIKQLVYVSVPFFIIIPVFFNVYWFVACALSSSCGDAFPLAYRILVLVFVFLIIGVLVWIIVVNWFRVELTIKIIQVASVALSANLRLFVMLPCLTLGLLVYFVPIVVFLVLSLSNGKIVPRESKEEYECVWKEDSWVPAYYALAILTMLWSAMVMLEAQVYVISGTIAQWYFSKDDLAPRRSIRSSLRNAFGPSFGTICLSGLLTGAVRVVRALVDSARQENGHGILSVALRCCVDGSLAAVDFLNKFTINFAAIIGEGYCISAKMTYELLKRNLLSAVFVETISTRLLTGIVFILSSIYAIVVCAILRTACKLGVESYIVAAAAWLVLMLALYFFVRVLDDVIDTVYVCYAVDRDRGEVCKPDIHEVYVHLPISRNHRSSIAPSSLL